MKKFSELSKKDRLVESSNNKQDFIKNLVEESLTVVEGEIVGKDTLVKTLNKIIEMNDSKTRIAILESVRVNAYQGGFDFNQISQAIEIEKQKLYSPIQEEVVEEEKEETIFARPNDKIVSIRESVEETEEEVEEVIEEAKKAKKCDEECDDEECEQEKDDENEDDEKDLEAESTKESVEEYTTIEKLVEELTEEELEGMEKIEGGKNAFFNRYKLKDGRMFDVSPSGEIIPVPVNDNGEPIVVQEIEVNDEDLTEEDIEGMEEIECENEFCKRYRLKDGRMFDVKPDGKIIQVVEESIEEENEEIIQESKDDIEEEIEEELEELEEAEEEFEEADQLEDIADQLEDVADELRDMAEDEEEEGEKEEIEELEEEIEELEEGKTNEEFFFYEDETVKDLEKDFDVKKIETFEESCELGTPLWDISNKPSEAKYKAEDKSRDSYYFDTYNEAGNIYFIFEKGTKKLLGSYYSPDKGEGSFVLPNNKMIKTIEEFKSVANKEIQKAVEQVTYIVTEEMREISDLASLCENIVNEHHLQTKKEKIEYILDNSDLEEIDKKIKKAELENMTDQEVDKAYLKCEKECK